MPPRKIRVLLRGSLRWLPVFEDELPFVRCATSRFRPIKEGKQRWPNLGPAFDFWRSHLLHQVYVQPESPKSIRVYETARRHEKPVIAHWIGSDVMHLREKIEQEGRLPRLVADCFDCHLSDSPELQEELAELGVKSEVIRLLPQSIEGKVSPMPDEPAVIGYCPDDRAEFYGIEILKSLAVDFPHVTFYLVANTGKGVSDAPSNMKFLGEVSDMNPIYEKSTALIRILEHDSVSAMVLEALARGRYAIYSKPFPHCLQASNRKEAAAHLQQLCANPSPNTAGAEYINTAFSWRNEMKKLRAIYERLL